MVTSYSLATNLYYIRGTLCTNSMQKLISSLADLTFRLPTISDRHVRFPSKYILHFLQHGNIVDSCTQSWDVER